MRTENGKSGAGLRLLIVDDEMPVVRSIMRNMEHSNYSIDYVMDGKAGLESLKKNEGYDVVVCDLMMPEVDGFEVLKKAKEIDPDIIFVMITAFSSIGAGVKAVMLGAYDFLEKPFDHDHLALIIQKGMETRRLKEENTSLKAQLEKSNQPSPFIGSSPSMQRVIASIEKLSSSSVNILVEGESGTGKELLAKHIHHSSQKRHGPFVALNCAAVPSELLESVLFGHEKGAFTGAVRTTEGLLETANNGTFFLDEVNNLGLDLQAKILRALQERTFRRVGGNKEISVDVRIIAASNKPLKQLVAERLFREDLYYRLNVVSFTLPPLRERVSDIPLLADYFVNDIAKNANKKCSLDDEVKGMLQKYSWPGNIRELRNVIEKIIAFYDPSDEDMIKNIVEELIRMPSTLGWVDSSLNDMSLEKIEMLHIIKVLEFTGGNKSEAAKLLKINYSTLFRKLKKYGVVTSDEKTFKVI